MQTNNPAECANDFNDPLTRRVARLVLLAQGLRRRGGVAPVRPADPANDNQPQPRHTHPIATDGV